MKSELRLIYDREGYFEWAVILLLKLIIKEYKKKRQEIKEYFYNKS